MTKLLPNTITQYTVCFEEFCYDSEELLNYYNVYCIKTSGFKKKNEYNVYTVLK